MPVQLNHTIVSVRDKRESATFLADLLGLAPPRPFGPFLVVQVDNDVSLDFADDHGPVHPQHYAFLVGEAEFDQIFGRIRERGLTHWADPGRRRPGQINTNDGGRGVYWEDPSGHFLEIITRPTEAEADGAEGRFSKIVLLPLVYLGLPGCLERPGSGDGRPTATARQWSFADGSGRGAAPAVCDADRRGRNTAVSAGSRDSDQHDTGRGMIGCASTRRP